jgi:hypothetical protein
MSLTQLLGGPQFDTVTNNEYALYADFHYFFNSGSVIRSNPWDSPQTPVAKTMTVTNITANDVALNYVNTSGSIVATTLTGSESTIITSQTLPLGLDTAPWLSVGSVTNHTGSVIARPTGSRFFEMAGIRTISQATNMYTIADGETTITKSSLSSPVSGSSFRYVCSRTIPYLDQPFWLIRDLSGCPGGTTTTTTAGPTTTTTSTTTTTTTTTTTAAPTTTTTSTTTTLSTKKYLIESCEGPADITAVVNILNAPTLVVNQRVHVVGSFAGLYCYRIANTDPAPSTSFNITIDAIYPDCESCPES